MPQYASLLCVDTMASEPDGAEQQAYRLSIRLKTESECFFYTSTQRGEQRKRLVAEHYLSRLEQGKARKVYGDWPDVPVPENCGSALPKASWKNYLAKTKTPTSYT